MAVKEGRSGREGGKGMAKCFSVCCCYFYLFCTRLKPEEFHTDSNWIMRAQPFSCTRKDAGTICDVSYRSGSFMPASEFHLAAPHVYYYSFFCFLEWWSWHGGETLTARASLWVYSCGQHVSHEQEGLTSFGAVRDLKREVVHCEI